MAGKLITALTAASGADLTTPVFAGMAAAGTQARKYTPAQVANGLTITGTTGTFTLTNGKTFAVTHGLTLSGTDSTVMTFPSTSATIARTDAANTFTGTQTITGDLTVGSTATSGDVNLNIGATQTTGTSSLQIGNGRTGNGFAVLDLVGDATYTDYAFRIFRLNSGANSDTQLKHRGTGNLGLTCEDAGGIGFSTNGILCGAMTSDGNTSMGRASLATNATDGFLYIPACAGTPTGTPTAVTGYAPMVIDSTNNKLYFRSGGTWRDAGP